MDYNPNSFHASIILYNRLKIETLHETPGKVWTLVGGLFKGRIEGLNEGMVGGGGGEEVKFGLGDGSMVEGLNDWTPPPPV